MKSVNIKTQEKGRRPLCASCREKMLARKEKVPLYEDLIKKGVAK